MTITYVDASRVGACKLGHDWRYDHSIEDKDGNELGVVVQCKRCKVQKYLWKKDRVTDN